MPKRSIRSWVLAVFACWLVLSAGADSFNLARFALLPFDADSEEPLPLNDPNSDFTQSPESQEPPSTSRPWWGCTSPGGQSFLQAILKSPFPTLAHSHPPRPCINAPLRC
jgi:hypothetical protein